MEIIFATIIGVALGVFIGILAARSKSKEQQGTIDKLQWQLESEKANAGQSALNLHKQLADAKSEAKEQIEGAADSE